MLAWRLGISAILIPALLAMFWVDAGHGPQATILLLFCALLTVRCSFETTQLLSVRGMAPSFPMTSLCSLLIIFCAWIHTLIRVEDGVSRLLVSLGCIAAGVVFSFAFLFLREAVGFRQPGTSMETLGAGLLAVMYSGMLLAVTCQFRWFPSPDIGYYAILSLVIAVKSGDTMAYTFGRLWGKRKMAPTLSPGKTWMGAVGAVVGAILGAGLWLHFGGQLFEASPVVSSWAAVVIYGVVMGVIGLAGDLCESLIKRDVQKKDSAALMPGFGGLLDLVDSVLFAAPFALVLWVFWPPAIVSP